MRAFWNGSPSSRTVSASKKEVRRSAIGFLARRIGTRVALFQGRQWISALEFAGVDEPAAHGPRMFSPVTHSLALAFSLYLDSSLLLTPVKERGMRFAGGVLPQIYCSNLRRQELRHSGHRREYRRQDDTHRENHAHRRILPSRFSYVCTRPLHFCSVLMNG